MCHCFSSLKWRPTQKLRPGANDFCGATSSTVLWEFETLPAAAATAVAIALLSLAAAGKAATSARVMEIKKILIRAHIWPASFWVMLRPYWCDPALWPDIGGV